MGYELTHYVIIKLERVSMAFSWEINTAVTTYDCVDQIAIIIDHLT